MARQALRSTPQNAANRRSAAYKKHHRSVADSIRLLIAKAIRAVSWPTSCLDQSPGTE
jgi:hypothetical protein